MSIEFNSSPKIRPSNHGKQPPALQKVLKQASEYVLYCLIREGFVKEDVKCRMDISIACLAEVPPSEEATLVTNRVKVDRRYRQKWHTAVSVWI